MAGLSLVRSLETVGASRESAALATARPDVVTKMRSHTVRRRVGATRVRVAACGVLNEPSSDVFASPRPPAVGELWRLPDDRGPGRRRNDDGNVSARVGRQLRRLRRDPLGVPDALLGHQPGAVLDHQHDVREWDRLPHADARADRHGQTVPRRRDALARHVDLRQGREPHPVREGLRRGVVDGAHLHALARRRLERARHRGPRPLQRPPADERHGLHRATDHAAGRAVGDADAICAAGNARFRSVGRLPRLHDRMDADRGALHDRRRAETNLVDHDRPAEAPPEHPADDLGIVRRELGGSDRGDHRADQRRLRLDPRLQLGAGRQMRRILCASRLLASAVVPRHAVRHQGDAGGSERPALRERRASPDQVAVPGPGGRRGWHGRHEGGMRPATAARVAPRAHPAVRELRAAAAPPEARAPAPRPGAEVRAAAGAPAAQAGAAAAPAPARGAAARRRRRQAGPVGGAAGRGGTGGSAGSGAAPRPSSPRRRARCSAPSSARGRSRSSRRRSAASSPSATTSTAGPTTTRHGCAPRSERLHPLSPGKPG